MMTFCRIFLLSALFITSLSLSHNGSATESSASFVTTEGTFEIGKVQERDGLKVQNELYFRHSVSSVKPMFGGWGLLRATVPSLTVDLLPTFTGAELKGVYVKNCENGEWINIQATRYLPQIGMSQSYINSAQQKFRYINRDEANQQQIYPGELIDPSYECGGAIVEILSYGGRKKLLSSGRVEFAYLIEFSK